MFANGSYAKLWKIKSIGEKYSDVRISTSVKNKKTDEYEQDFGSFVRMVGQAHQQMEYMNEGDRFQIVRCGVTNKYDKEKNVTYWNPVIFEIERSEEEQQAEKNPFLEE